MRWRGRQHEHEPVRGEKPSGTGRGGCRDYAAISDPESFFTALGEEVARQIDDLTDELVGEIRQNDSYLAHVGRLFAARAIAEELILPQRVLPDPELAADDNQDYVPPENGERPIVVERDHPSWAEVNAE